jgi:hypothetical protein
MFWDECRCIPPTVLAETLALVERDMEKYPSQTKKERKDIFEDKVNSIIQDLQKI